MLPKSRRFTTEDFRKMRGGRTVHAPHFFIRMSPVSPANGKAAVIVSGATYKKAVDRNLLRRRMYHLIGKHGRILHGCASTATFKKGALDLSFKELEAEFLKLMKQT